MRIVTLDMESFWDVGHTLSKMSPVEYVMHPNTEIISCAIKIGNSNTNVFFGEEAIRHALHQLDWSNTAALAHNVAFDGLILNWRFGITPKMYMCTMAMARPIHAKTTGLSLAKLVAHYGLGVKNNAVLMQTRGKHLADFTAQELADMGKYNGEDTDQCYALFHKLLPHYTATELWQIDALTRMRIEPKFQVDRAMLETALSMERDQKRKHILMLAKHLRANKLASESIAACTTVESVEAAVRIELASAPKFAALLASLNVPVPTKPSPTDPDKQIPALAKTDEAFTDLQQHDNPVVAAAARARLAVKSTLLETRITKFLTASSLAGGLLPVPLRYCGADTTGRDSGEEYNCFTGETEVLTRTGWVRFDEWQGQPIAQWWSDNRVTYEQTPGSLSKPYSGQLVDIDGVLFSSAMTPEHRMVALYKGRVKERTAGWVADHSGLDQIPTGGRVEGVNTQFTADEVRLLVAIAADGTVVARKTQRPTIQFGFRRARKIARMRALLEALGVKYVEREYPAQVGHTGEQPTTTFFLPDCGYDKGFGPWILDLPAPMLDVLIEEAAHWDGWKHAKTGAVEFSTSQRDQAEWFATAVHLSGRATTLRGYTLGRFQLHVRESNTTSVTRSNVRVRDYEGPVYCASVESSYILIRRNGKIAVAGQCQNLPRIGTPPKISDALRNCLKAPKGYQVIVADQSGIELRVNHFLWKVKSSMDLYAANPEADLYKAFAAARYQKTPEEVTKPERQLAKVAQLGLGFGAGWKTFLRVAKTMGGLDLTDDESEGITNAWRTQYAEIVRGWKVSGAMLQRVHAGEEHAVDPWGMVTTCSEGLRLPSGRLIRYPQLRQEEGKWPDGRARQDWVYATGRHKSYMHGGKVVENMVQALARDSIFDCSVDFYKATKLRPCLRVHDELVYVVPTSEAVSLLAELQRIMRTPPKWWPELVVHSEGDSALSYGAAK